MPFVSSVGILGVILRWLRCNNISINLVGARTRTVPLKTGQFNAWTLQATVCDLLHVFWQVPSVIQASRSIKYPHPVSPRLAVS